MTNVVGKLVLNLFILYAALLCVLLFSRNTIIPEATMIFLYYVQKLNNMGKVYLIALETSRKRLNSRTC